MISSTLKLVPLEHPWIETSRAPLYEIKFPRQASDQDVARFCEVREQWATLAKYPVAWVVDLANIVVVSATQRRIFGDHLSRFEQHDVAYNQGSALVVPNALVRGIVTAVFWLKAPAFANECFATRDAAVAWARTRLGAYSQRP